MVVITRPYVLGRFRGSPNHGLCNAQEERVTGESEAIESGVVILGTLVVHTLRAAQR